MVDLLFVEHSPLFSLLGWLVVRQSWPRCEFIIVIYLSGS